MPASRINMLQPKLDQAATRARAGSTRVWFCSQLPISTPNTDSPVFSGPLPEKIQMNTMPESTGERSEEHTSELQSRGHLVCRLLLEKKNTNDSDVRVRPIASENESLEP